MALVSYDDTKAYVMDRARELNDGTSGFATSVGYALDEAWRYLYTCHPWLCLRKYPAGVILTLPSITDRLLTTTAGSAAATITPAPSAISVAGYIIIPEGKDYLLRITAHTLFQTSITVDGAPETLTDAPCVIAKIDYALPSDCGILADSKLYLGREDEILVVGEEELRHEHPDPPTAEWPPRRAARITKGTLRLSSYPTTRARIEVPYNAEPADPSGSGALVIDRHLIPVWANHALSLMYEYKNDARIAAATQRFDRALDKAHEYEDLLRLGLGDRANRRRSGPYQD